MEVREIAGVPTHILSLSGENDDGDVPLVVIIPGSPGMGHFYVPFASKLFNIGQGKYDVSVVSHAGHSPGHYKNTVNSTLEEYRRANMRGDHPLGGIQAQSENESDSVASTTAETVNNTGTDWYTLEDQITHKLAFIEREVRTRKSLVLIGHSIGCWMILKMLPYLDPMKIHRVFMLFPTIEKMALTPNAQSFSSYLWTSLRIPFTGLVWMASRLIPHRMKMMLLGWHFHTTPSEHLKHITQGAVNIDEKGIYNILKMAKQEMDVVTAIPLQVIDKNIGKMVFYYGVGDRWNVDCCYRDMAARYPDKDIYLCERGIDHAFVECSSNDMATFVHSKLKFF